MVHIIFFRFLGDIHWVAVVVGMAFIVHFILSDSWWYIQLAAVPVRFMFLFRVFKLRCRNCYSTLRFENRSMLHFSCLEGNLEELIRSSPPLSNWLSLGDDLVCNLDGFSFKKFNSSCSHLCPSLWLRKIKHFMLSEFFLWNSAVRWMNRDPCAISTPRPPAPPPRALWLPPNLTLHALEFFLWNSVVWWSIGTLDWLIACLRFLQIWHFRVRIALICAHPFQCVRYDDTSCSRTLSLEFRRLMEIHVH